MAKWKEIRDLTVAIVAEGTTAPASNLFVNVSTKGDLQRHVEISFDALTFAGTVAASSAKIGVWRMVGNRIDKVGTIDLFAATYPEARILEHFNGEKIWLRVESFSGGTAPTLGTKMHARGQ